LQELSALAVGSSIIKFHGIEVMCAREVDKANGTRLPHFTREKGNFVPRGKPVPYLALSRTGLVEMEEIGI
jgi:hypothetical protein